MIGGWFWVVGLLFAPLPADGEWDALKVRIESAPQEVATFIERRAGCNHFLGEEPYDRERAAEIGKALRELRCARLEEDERGLKRTYRRQPSVLRLLDDTRELLGW